MMNWNIEEKENKLYVTLTVDHVKNQRHWTNRCYTKDAATQHLQEQNIRFGELLQDCEVYNYQRVSDLTGTWVFSLPSKPKIKKTTKSVEKKANVIKPKIKKTTKSVEKKENVIKIKTKKTIKK